MVQQERLEQREKGLFGRKRKDEFVIPKADLHGSMQENIDLLLKARKSREEGFSTAGIHGVLSAAIPPLAIFALTGALMAKASDSKVREVTRQVGKDLATAPEMRVIAFKAIADRKYPGLEELRQRFTHAYVDFDGNLVFTTEKRAGEILRFVGRMKVPIK